MSSEFLSRIRRRRKWDDDKNDKNDDDDETLIVSCAFFLSKSHVRRGFTFYWMLRSRCS